MLFVSNFHLSRNTPVFSLLHRPTHKIVPFTWLVVLTKPHQRLVPKLPFMAERHTKSTSSLASWRVVLQDPRVSNTIIQTSPSIPSWSSSVFAQVEPPRLQCLNCVPTSKKKSKFWQTKLLGVKLDSPIVTEHVAGRCSK